MSLEQYLITFQALKESGEPRAERDAAIFSLTGKHLDYEGIVPFDYHGSKLGRVPAGGVNITRDIDSVIGFVQDLGQIIVDVTFNPVSNPIKMLNKDMHFTYEAVIGVRLSRFGLCCSELMNHPFPPF